MNATYIPRMNPWSGLLLMMLALPLGTIALLLISIAILASLVMILTPIGMILAPTWSVQLFQWKFESASEAWYLPALGILLDMGLVYALKALTRLASPLLNPSHN